MKQKLTCTGRKIVTKRFTLFLYFKNVELPIQTTLRFENFQLLFVRKIQFSSLYKKHILYISCVKTSKMKRCPSICMFVRMSWINYQLQMKESLFIFRRFRLVFLHIFISNLAVLQCCLPNWHFFRGLVGKPFQDRMGSKFLEDISPFVWPLIPLF